jgi:hypothetical protein
MHISLSLSCLLPNDHDDDDNNYNHQAVVTRTLWVYTLAPFSCMTLQLLLLFLLSSHHAMPEERIPQQAIVMHPYHLQLPSVWKFAQDFPESFSLTHSCEMHDTKKVEIEWRRDLNGRQVSQQLVKILARVRRARIAMINHSQFVTIFFFYNFQRRCDSRDLSFRERKTVRCRRSVRK